MADFRIRVRVDSGGARKGTAEVKKALTGVETKAKAVGRSLAQVFGFVGAAAVVTQGIRTLSDFSETMATVGAISGATANQFKDLTAVAEELGATTRFSATQAGEGLLFLARAGFSVEESIATVDDTLRLAQAGALELGQAADIATNVLTGFRLPVSDATRVVDVLALAANSANTSVGQFGEAMKFVAPVAAGVKVPIEEAGAAIGALSDAGLQASLAGTGLRAVLASLERPGGAQTVILDELGVKAEEVQISTVGLTGALKVLAAAGIDTGQALALFGKRGGPAFDVLVNSIPKIEGLNAKLKEAEGTADRVSKIMDTSLKGALLAVKSAFEAVIISAGRFGGEGGLQQFLRGLANLLRGLARNFEVIQKAIQITAIVLFTQLVPGLIASGKAGTFLEKSLVKVTAQMARLRAVMNLTPWGIAVTLVTALVAAIVLFRDKIKLVGQEYATLGDFISASFEVLNTLFKDVLATIFRVEAASISLSGGISKVVSFLLAMFQGVLQVFDILGKGILGTVSGIINNFGLIPSALQDVFIKAINLALAELEKFANKAIGVIDKVNTFFGRQLIGDVTIGRIKNSAEGGAKAFADAFKLTFQEEFKQAGLEDIFLDVFSRAEANAEKKRLAAIARASAGGTEAPESIVAPREAAGEGATFASVLRGLAEERELLKLNSAERQIAIDLIELESQVKGGFLPVQRQIVEERLREIQSLERQAGILEEFRGPQQEFIAQQQALLALQQQGKISWEEYSIALDNARLASLQFSTSIDAGVSRGLLRLKSEIMDLGAVAERTLTNAFRGAEDAIVSFVTTGKADIRGFVNSVLADLTRLLLRQGISSLIGAFAGGATGGAGGGAGGLLGGLVSGLAGKQQGGSFMVGGSGGPDSQLVAFKGSPGERVDVTRKGATPQAAQASAAPPQVNVKVVNVDDASSAIDAISSVQGERAVMNVLQRNPKTVRRLLGG